jgi:hypothetical protein
VRIAGVRGLHGGEDGRRNHQQVRRPVAPLAAGGDRGGLVRLHLVHSCRSTAVQFFLKKPFPTLSTQVLLYRGAGSGLCV